MINIKKTIITGAILLISAVSYGQTVSFLNILQDARAMGMGGASVAMSANAFAMHNNPAAISLSESRFAIGANYTMWQPTSAKNNLMGIAGYFKIGDKFGIGLNGRYLTHPSYEVTDGGGAISTPFSPNEYAIDLGFSYKIISGLSIGATIKYIGSSMADSEFVPDYLNGTAFAADIAVMYKLGKLNIALMGTNLGTKISYGATDIFGKYNLPAMIKAGVGYDLILAEKHKLTATLEANYLIYQKGFAAGAGVEYSFADSASPLKNTLTLSLEFEF